jgi:hypothetical protein
MNRISTATKIHFIMAKPNFPWADLSCRPREGLRKSIDNTRKAITSPGARSEIYTRPSERPGFGWDVEVT